MAPRDTIVSISDTAIEQHDALFVLLELVRTGKAVTRSDLGKLSGLGRSIVSQRIDEAVEIGLLEEADFGSSTGGRIPRTLRFRHEIGNFLVAEFGARNLGVAVTDLAGRTLHSKHEEWDITTGPEKSLKRVSEVFESFKKENPELNLWGVVVGVPGPVEYETGKPVAPPIMPGWNGFDIKDFFGKLYHAPVWVDNDVNLMAIGEQTLMRSLSAQPETELSDLLFVKVGSGIGAGIISGGKVHRGANGSAGDIGHIAVSEESKVICRCGQLGCLEAIAGGWALARDGEVACREGKSEYLAGVIAKKGFLSAADISSGATRGDSYCMEAVARSGRLVGETLATLVNFFNPGVVVIGGSIAETGDLFLASVRQTVYRRSLPLATRDLRIISSEADHKEGLVGGAALAQTEIFTRSHMNRWIEQQSRKN